MTRPHSSARHGLSPGSPRADSRPNAGDFEIVAAGWWVTLFGGMVAFGVVACSPKATQFYRRHVRDTSPARLRSGFALAATVHALEARAAYRSARAHGLTRSAPLWGMQTLAVGFPSLLALRRISGGR